MTYAVRFQASCSLRLFHWGIGVPARPSRMAKNTRLVDVDRRHSTFVKSRGARVNASVRWP